MHRPICLIGLVSAAFVAVLDFSQAVPQEPEVAKSDTLYKPRIINTTDLGADPDDEQSMVRQLVSANEFDIEGLIRHRVDTGGCRRQDDSYHIGGA